MKLDKYLEEVWHWKEKAYEETKGMTMEERVKRIKLNADMLLLNSGIQLQFFKRETEAKTHI